MYIPDFSQNVMYLEECESTNKFADALIKSGNDYHGQVIRTDFQTHGKGQSGNSWFSSAGMNILSSLILSHTSYQFGNQFYLSMMSANALIDALNMNTDGFITKWPNDILWKNKKAGGLLIENSVMGVEIKNSIIGFGININQEEFPDFLPNPVSLKIITGKTIDLECIFNQILGAFKANIEMLYSNQYQQIKQKYISNLKGYHTFLNYKDKNVAFSAEIIDVEHDGRLILSDKHGEIRKYYFKEVELIL